MTQPGGQRRQGLVDSTREPDEEGTGSGESGGGGALLQISNAMVRLYKEAFGRGPTKSRAQFAGPNMLIVLLEDSMTVAERNLAALNAHDRLREARMFFQYSLETEFRGIVERFLGRRTVAFVSGVDTHVDLSVELFTLEPEQAQADPPVAH